MFEFFKQKPENPVAKTENKKIEAGSFITPIKQEITPASIMGAGTVERYKVIRIAGNKVYVQSGIGAELEFDITEVKLAR